MKRFVFLVMSLSLSAMDEETSSYYSADQGMQSEVTQEKEQLSYGACPKVTKLLDKNFYQQAVQELPICCIDIFLLDLSTNRYLLVYRKNRPAKGVFWIPGGRMQKGESFFESAQRKCLEEIGITIQTKKVLGVYNLIFPDSEWATPTHTPAIVVLATCNPQKGSVSLDELHADYKWVSLFEPSKIDYIEKIRKKVLKVLDKEHCKL